LICMECPELLLDLTRQFAKEGERGAGGVCGEHTVQPGWYAKVEMENGKVRVSVPEDGSERTYGVKAVGSSVQELWLCGGLEGFVLKSIQ